MADSAAESFECENCGSGELLIPENPSDEAPVKCASCDGTLTNWAVLRSKMGGQAFKLTTDNSIRQIRLRKA